MKHMMWLWTSGFRFHAQLAHVSGWINDTCKLVVAAIGLCRHVVRIGGGFCWEFTNDNEFWDLAIARNFFTKCDTSSCLVSTAAVGQQFVDCEECVFYVKKKLKIVTTWPKLIEVMAPYARIPEHLGSADFRPRCEKVCADRFFFFMPIFAELVWRALRTVTLCLMVVLLQASTAGLSCARW